MAEADDASSLFIIAFPPPPGVKPNFVNPESRAYQARITIAVCSVVMVLFVGVRVYAQLAITRMWAADDYMCVAAAITTLAYGGLVLAALGPTLGPHIWNIPITYATSKTVRLPVIGSCVFAVCSACARLALLLLYLRLFARPPNRATRYVLYAGMAVTVVFNIVYAALLLALVMQRPGEDPLVAASRTAASVRPAGALYMAQAVFSAASDAYVLAVPVRLVWRLNKPWRTRLRVSAVFMTGMLACGCAAARIVYRVQLMRSADASWLAIPYYCVSVAEVNIGIICSCVPANWGAYRELRTKLRRQLASLSSSRSSPSLTPSLSAVFGPLASCFRLRWNRAPQPVKTQSAAAMTPATTRHAHNLRKPERTPRLSRFPSLCNGQQQQQRQRQHRQQQQQMRSLQRLPAAAVADEHGLETMPANSFDNPPTPERCRTHRHLSATQSAAAAAGAAAASTSLTRQSVDNTPTLRAPATATTTTATTATTTTTTTTTTMATFATTTSPRKTSSSSLAPTTARTAASGVSLPPTPRPPPPGASIRESVVIAHQQPPSLTSADGNGYGDSHGDYATTIATAASTATPSLDLALVLLPLPEVLLPPCASSSTCTRSTPLAELKEFILRYDGGAAATETAAAQSASVAAAYDGERRGSRSSARGSNSGGGENYDDDDGTLREC